MSSACFGSSNPNIHSASLPAPRMAGAAAIPAVLDALQLDEELEALLYARCEAVCRHAGGKVVNRFEPELRAVLRAALWYLSTVSGEATPAQQLLNMHRVAGAALPRALLQRGPALEPANSEVYGRTLLRVPRRSSVIYGVLTVLLPWAWARISQLGIDHPERLRWLRWMRFAEGWTTLASVLVSAHFDVRGRWPTLPMALVGMQLVYTLPNRPYVPNLEFALQQRIWREMADVAVAARALYHSRGRLVGAAAVRVAHSAAAPPGPLTRCVRAAAGRLGLLAPTEEDDPDDAIDAERQGCVFCAAHPANTPTPAPCGHMCCYFCVSVARMASARATCPRCKVSLHASPSTQRAVRVIER